MELQAFLRLLRKVSGPTANGEYEACCPCHDDTTPSMTVGVKRSNKDGKTRIYCCCQRGKNAGTCSTADIVQSLGLTMRDLIVDPDEQEQGQKRKTSQKAQEPALVVRQAKPVAAMPPEKDKGDDMPSSVWEHPAAIYRYTDAAGVELFQVVL